MRECGECNLCCKVLNIPEYNAPAGTMCEHCTDKGCSIYEERHDICRGFSCLWLSQPQIPESLRPDKSGILFELPAGGMTYIGHLIEEDALNKPEIQIFIDKIAEAGHPVLIQDTRTNKKMYKLAQNWTKEMVQIDVAKMIKKHQEEGRI